MCYRHVYKRNDILEEEEQVDTVSGGIPRRRILGSIKLRQVLGADSARVPVPANPTFYDPVAQADASAVTGGLDSVPSSCIVHSLVISTKLQE